jgi:NDP-sugar pyrophosphorylase family protein
MLEENKFKEACRIIQNSGLNDSFNYYIAQNNISLYVYDMGEYFIISTTSWFDMKCLELYGERFKELKNCWYSKDGQFKEYMYINQDLLSSYYKYCTTLSGRR